MTDWPDAWVGFAGVVPVAAVEREARGSELTTLGARRTPASVSAPEVSIVIPVFDEEAILHAAVVDLRERLAPLGLVFEVILAENGSHDQTLPIAAELSRKYPEVRLLSVPEPNYGRALREGIEAARGTYVICEEIDLCDTEFHARALALLRTGMVELVIGSKLAPGAHDRRPLVRHLASRAYSTLLRAAVGFEGTDTHGLKAFRREALLPVVRACVVDKDVFASELVVRAQRAGLSLREIPVTVLEKRTPSINLVRRVPSVLSRVVRLRRALGE